VRSQKDVGGFYITVDNAFAVEVFNAVEDSEEDLDGRLDMEAVCKWRSCVDIRVYSCGRRKKVR
jgi:hypothetical protein